jgi:DNA invertase Pin-like site-specific DNA recombinase
VKAFAYLRVSDPHQIKGDGFKRQELAIRAYAAAHGITIVKVYREMGICGGVAHEDRPAWAELIKALYANGTKAVIVERLDRFARDLMVQEVAIRDLQKAGFELISVAEPDLMANDPGRKLMRQIMGSIAEYDKATIVAKLRGARERKKAATGRCEGTKPYGHYPGEVANLERMKAGRAAGVAYDKLAAQMNAEGLVNRAGGAWWGGNIRRILTTQVA